VVKHLAAEHLGQMALVDKSRPSVHQCERLASLTQQAPCALELALDNKALWPDPGAWLYEQTEMIGAQTGNIGQRGG
jgi:hypothetical protein